MESTVLILKRCSKQNLPMRDGVHTIYLLEMELTTYTNERRHVQHLFLREVYTAFTHENENIVFTHEDGIYIYIYIYIYFLMIFGVQHMFSHQIFGVHNIYS